jgi:hypothetical protein
LHHRLRGLRNHEEHQYGNRNNKSRFWLVPALEDAAAQSAILREASIATDFEVAGAIEEATLAAV